MDVESEMRQEPQSAFLVLTRNYEGKQQVLWAFRTENEAREWIKTQLEYAAEDEMPVEPAVYVLEEVPYW